MSQDIYIVNNLPGALGYLVSGMIHKHYLSNELPVMRDDIIFDEDKPDLISKDWFYNHWSINPATTGSHVCNVFHLPDYENIQTKYPNAKNIVVTYSLDDCNTVATSIFEHYYIKSWENDDYVKDSFKNTIENYPNFFPDSTITPFDLTLQQKRTLQYILSNQAVLAGYHNLVIPDSPNIFEIKYQEMIYKPEIFKEKMCNILNVDTLHPAVLVDYNDFLTKYHQFVYNRYKYHYEST